MSERRIEIDAEMPSGYEKLDGLEAVINADGTNHVNGVINLGRDENQKDHRIQNVHDPLEMWGYDTDTSDWELRKANPEMWQLKRTMELLAERVNVLEAKNQALERNEERMAQEIIRLGGKIDALSVPADPDIISPAAPPMDRPVLDDTAPGEKPVVIVPEDEVIVAPVADTGPRTVTTTTTTETWYRRPRNWAAAGAAVVLLAIGAYTLHEVEEIEHSQSNIENTLSNTNLTEPSQQQSDGEEDNESNGKMYGPSLTEAQAGSSYLNGMHDDYYNQTVGHRLTGVRFTKNTNLKLKKQSNGSFAFVSEDNKVVIPKVGWDSQGKIDKATRQKVNQLSSQGYRMSWGSLGTDPNRKITILSKS